MKILSVIAYQKVLTQPYYAIVSGTARSVQERRVSHSRGKARGPHTGPGSGAESLRNLNLIHKPWLTVPTELGALPGGNELDAQHTLRICRIGAGQEFLEICSAVAIAINVGCRPFQRIATPVQTLPIVRQAIEVIVLSPGSPGCRCRERRASSVGQLIGQLERVTAACYQSCGRPDIIGHDHRRGI